MGCVNSTPQGPPRAESDAPAPVHEHGNEAQAEKRREDVSLEEMKDAADATTQEEQAPGAEDAGPSQPSTSATTTAAGPGADASEGVEKDSVSIPAAGSDAPEEEDANEEGDHDERQEASAPLSRTTSLSKEKVSLDSPQSQIQTDEDSENNAAAASPEGPGSPNLDEIPEDGEAKLDGNSDALPAVSGVDSPTPRRLSVKEKAALFASGQIAQADAPAAPVLQKSKTADPSSSGMRSVREIAAKYSSGGPNASADSMQNFSAERMDEVNSVTRRRNSSQQMRQYWQTKQEVERIVVSRKEF